MPVMIHRSLKKFGDYMNTKISPCTEVESSCFFVLCDLHSGLSFLSCSWGGEFIQEFYFHNLNGFRTVVMPKL